MDNLSEIIDEFIDGFTTTSRKPFEYYLEFIEDIDINKFFEDFKFWDVNHSFIIKLPIEIQHEIIADYFRSATTDLNLELTKIVYYWFNYFKYYDKIHDIKIEDTTLLSLKNSLDYYINKQVSRYSSSKFMCFFFLKYKPEDVFIGPITEYNTIDYILIGLLFSNIDVWKTKKIIDKIVKSGVHFEDSFDILNFIFIKYDSYGIDTKKIFGTIVDIVKIEFND